MSGERFDIIAHLAAKRARLESRRAMEIARIAGERAERERDEAELQRQRDEEWAAQCRADRRQSASILTWRRGSV